MIRPIFFILLIFGLGSKYAYSFNDGQPTHSNTPAIYTPVVNADSRTAGLLAPGDTLKLDIGCQDFLPGDSICIPVTVENFDSIEGLQFKVVFDPKILDLKAIANPAFSGIDFNILAADGLLTVIWTANDPESLPDGTVLFTMCFKAKGNPGQSSDIVIDDVPAYKVKDLIMEAVGTFQGKTIIVPMVGDTCNSKIQSPNGIFIGTRSCGTNQAQGQTDGEVSFSIYGGTGPYNYTWEHSTGTPNGNGSVPANTPVNLFGLKAGTYTITVTDATGATQTASITIQTSKLDFTLDKKNPSCYGASDGRVYITPGNFGGGLMPYFVEWSTGEKFSWKAGDAYPEITNLPQGNYTITVTDGSGCVKTLSIYISVQPISANINVTPATCTGKPDGSIVVTAGGGTPVNGTSYDYTWTEGATQHDVGVTSTLNNKVPGSYKIQIKDANGCVLDTSFIITAQKTLFVNMVTDSVICNGEKNGGATATITVTGGNEVMPYTYEWKDNAQNPVGFTNKISNQNAGVYYFKATDGEGCVVLDTATIGQPDILAVNLLRSVTDTCSKNTGLLYVFGSGGTPKFNQFPAYDFKWSNGVTDQENKNLATGTYSITVTDTKGCSATGSYFVDVVGATKITFDSTNVACPGDNTGSIIAHFNPALPQGAQISWSSNAPTPVNTSTTSTLTGLSAGLYIISVTTSDGCTNIDSVHIIAPDFVQVDSLVTPPTCFYTSDGSIRLTLTGGKPPYNIVWNDAPSEKGPVRTGLKPGTYKVSITDGGNCPAQEFTFFLPTPSLMNFSIFITASPSCEGVCNGVVSLNMTGDVSNGPFTISWLPNKNFPGLTETNVTKSKADNLCTGYQHFLITDTKGCIRQDSILLSPTTVIKIDEAGSVIKDVTCFGDGDGSIDVIAVGGKSPYTFNWQGGQTGTQLTNLQPGDYLVTITDADGCDGLDTVVIKQPELFVLSVDSIQTSNVSCGGYADGKIVLKWKGGNAGNPVFTWSGNESQTFTASNLKSGVYVITATDSKGCSSSVSVTLTEPIPVVADLKPIVEPLCYGFTTTVEINNASGGTGTGYTFSIDDANQVPITSPYEVYAGKHVVKVFDSNGCAFIDTILIDQPPQIIVDLGPDVTIELGDSVQLQPNVNSVLPVDTFFWKPLTSLSCGDCYTPFARPFDDTKYTLTVQDQNGCQGAGSVTVIVDKNRKIFIPNVFSPDDNGTNDIFEVYSGNGAKTIKSMKIYNRWGGQVFQAENLPASKFGSGGWNGTFKGQPADVGVYVYLIEVEFLDNVTILYRGDLTVITQYK